MFRIQSINQSRNQWMNEWMNQSIHHQPITEDKQQVWCKEMTTTYSNVFVLFLRDPTTLKFQRYYITCSKCPPAYCMPANSRCATASVPVSSWYPQLSHFGPLLNDVVLSAYHSATISTSRNDKERSLTDWSRVIEPAKQLVRFFQSLFLHNVRSKILATLCRNEERCLAML